jgi:hypothetical protein
MLKVELSLRRCLGLWTVVCTIQYHPWTGSINQVCNIFNFTVYWKFFRDCIFSLTPVTYARLALFRINVLKIVQANRMKNGKLLEYTIWHTYARFFYAYFLDSSDICKLLTTSSKQNSVFKQKCCEIIKVKLKILNIRRQVHKTVIKGSSM